MSSQVVIGKMKIWVVKRDAHGQEVWRYPGRVLQQDLAWVLIEAFFNRDAAICGQALRQGDRALEVFFFRRWYNLLAIYEQHTPKLKGYYANIARPAFWQGNALVYDDLALDLWVWPDGEMCVLDEDEFAQLALDASTQAQAKLALQTLQRQFGEVIKEVFPTAG